MFMWCMCCDHQTCTCIDGLEGDGVSSCVCSAANGWHAYGTGCYKKMADNQQFATALSTCATISPTATLPCVHDDGEARFLAAHFASDTVKETYELWTGYNDQAGTGTFVWPTGCAAVSRVRISCAG